MSGNKLGVSRAQLCPASCILHPASAWQRPLSAMLVAPSLMSSLSLCEYPSWHFSVHLPQRCHHGTQTPGDPRPGSSPQTQQFRLPLLPNPTPCSTLCPLGCQFGFSGVSLPSRGFFDTLLYLVTPTLLCHLARGPGLFSLNIHLVFFIFYPQAAVSTDS